MSLDANLYLCLEKWAADELRSINAQIEFLLKEAVRRAGRLKSASDLAAVDEKTVK
jgi:hypothetical protein